MKGESNPKECLLNTGRRVVGVRGEAQHEPESGDDESVCVPIPFLSSLL